MGTWAPFLEAELTQRCGVLSEPPQAWAHQGFLVALSPAWNDNPCFTRPHHGGWGLSKRVGVGVLGQEKAGNSPPPPQGTPAQSSIL